MITNTKWIKILKFISLSCFLLVLVAFIVTFIVPGIEFSSVKFNRFWDFLMGYFMLISALSILLVIKSFKGIVRQVIRVIATVVGGFAFLIVFTIHAKIEYEPRYDRYIVYRNMNKANQYVVVQDYRRWKMNQSVVDTALIDDYYLMRKCNKLQSMNVKGTWIKMDEKGKVIDTLVVK